MKTLKKILFITFFIICILSNIVLAKTGKVNIEAARVRQEANTTSNIITVIYEDDEVEILEESGDWYKVKYKNDTGYVKKAFITENKKNSSSNSISTNVANIASTIVLNTTNTTNTTQEEPSTPKDEPQNSSELPADGTTLVINSETYVKVLPNFSSNNIVKFEASKQVQKLAEINNWIQVTDGEYAGWILKVKVQTGAVEEPTTEPQTAENENTTNTAVNNISTSNTVSNTVSNTTSSSNSLNKKATIIVETAIVREKPTTSSDAIGVLDYDDDIILLEQDGDWYKINFENQTGYIKNTLIKIFDDSVSSRSLSEERKEIASQSDQEKEEIASSSKGTDVVNYAKQFLGCSYVAGGKNPNTGFDCSGFTRYVFLNFDYSLGSTSLSQKSVGTEVSRDNLMPGDLILFLGEDKSGIGHTGIYIGGSEFIHAANPQRGVVTDNLNTNSYYNERFVTARRIVN